MYNFYSILRHIFNPPENYFEYNWRLSQHYRSNNFSFASFLFSLVDNEKLTKFSSQVTLGFLYGSSIKASFPLIAKVNSQARSECFRNLATYHLASQLTFFSDKSHFQLQASLKCVRVLAPLEGTFGICACTFLNLIRIRLCDKIQLSKSKHDAFSEMHVKVINFACKR